MKSWKILMTTLLATGGAVSLAPAAHAATNATDNAADAVYTDGWQTGDNGGSGWGSGWTLTASNGNPSNAGQFVYTSTSNADGSDNGNTNGVAGDGDIDTSGRAWGMYGNSGQTSNAYRSFSGALSVGQSFRLDMDNGYLDGNGSANEGTDGTVGFGLQDSNGNNRLEVFFVGGDPTYTVRDSTSHASTVGYTDEGLTIVVTLTGTNTYSVTLTRKDGATDTVTGTLGGTLDSAITQFRLFNFNAGSDGSNNAYFNSVAVTPEPASLSLLLLAGLPLIGRRRVAK